MMDKGFRIAKYYLLGVFTRDYKCTLIANLTLKIEENFNGIDIIQEFSEGINKNQIRFSRFKGDDIEMPF